MKIILIILGFILVSHQIMPKNNVIKIDFANPKILDQIESELIWQTKPAKFVFDGRDFIVSLSGEKRPKHDDLGKGLKVKSAGYIQFVYRDKKLSSLFLNNRSAAYCPKFDSLHEVRDFIKKSSSVFTKLPFDLKNEPNPKCLKKKSK